MKYKTIFFDLDGTITDSASNSEALSDRRCADSFVKFVVLRMKKVRGWLKIIESITVTKGFLEIMYMTA